MQSMINYVLKQFITCFIWYIVFSGTCSNCFVLSCRVCIYSMDKIMNMIDVLTKPDCLHVILRIINTPATNIPTITTDKDPPTIAAVSSCVCWAFWLCSSKDDKGIYITVVINNDRKSIESKIILILSIKLDRVDLTTSTYRFYKL